MQARKKLDKIRFLAEIKNGKLVLNNERYFRHHISQFEDCKVSIEIERERSTRSEQQNKYYWVCLEVIATETGHTKEELHSAFKKMFLPRHKVEVNGKVVYLEGSTTRLNISQFMEYMERISAEAAQLGITLPTPESHGFALHET